MSRGQIIVDTAQLETTAKNVEELANSYNSEYGILYSHVSEMQNSWSGADNQAYTNQIEGFKDDFKRMEDIMRDYVAFLRETVRQYRETQSEIKADVKKLATDA